MIVYGWTLMSFNIDSHWKMVFVLFNVISTFSASKANEVLFEVILVWNNTLKQICRYLIISHDTIEKWNELISLYSVAAQRDLLLGKQSMYRSAYSRANQGEVGVMWVRTPSTLFRESQNFIKMWGGGNVARCMRMHHVLVPNGYPDPPFRNPVSVPDILHLKLQTYKDKVMVMEVSFL